MEPRCGRWVRHIGVSTRISKHYTVFAVTKGKGVILGLQCVRQANHRYIEISKQPLGISRAKHRSGAGNNVS
ncbi:MAG: hypothetical protein BWX66_01204 [Deltaproteobacteria bacterium ADurb.Bin058]|nr:MAG: hypothetical protein BWX66_01204 [Deltaproteobacteria bacterium ADurb.Bin058]